MNLKFKKTWLFIGVIQILVTFYLCLRQTIASGQEVEHLDKLFHFSTYLLLTFYQVNIHGPKQKYKIFLFFMLLGSLIEVLQFFTGYRSFDLYDILANSLGSAYAIIFSIAFQINILAWLEKLPLKHKANIT